MKKNILMMLAITVALGILVTGCGSKKWEEQVTVLEARVDSLSTELEGEQMRTAQLNEELARSLSEQRAMEQVWLEEREGLTTITIDGEVTFNSGSARINDEGQEILNRIWEVLRGYDDREILIEGHTDNVQIAPRFHDKYKSNWELSSARAHAVLHHAVVNYNADPSRVAAVGYGEFRPLVGNDTEDGRTLNRRVVITVGPRSNPPRAMP